AIEGGNIGAHLSGDLVRRHLLPGGIGEAPGESGLVVEVDAGDVGPGPVDHRPPHDAHRAPARDVGIGPVALHANIHLVSAAHHAVGDEIDAGAEEVGLVIVTVVAVEEVEAEAVLALNALLRLLAGAAPVDQAKAALPQLAVDLDIGLRGSAVAGRL